VSFDFPNTPAEDQEFTPAGGATYVYKAPRWLVKSVTYAPLDSPVFTGDPKAPTPLTADNDTSVATTAYVQANLTNYAPLASPTFTGDPKAPTPTAGDNDTSIATTAFVNTKAASYLPLAGGTLTGNLTISSAGALVVQSTTASSSPTTGALTVAGGLGVAGTVYAQGDVYTTSAVVRFGSTPSTNYLWWDGTRYRMAGGPFWVTDGTVSTSPTTGALQVAGGAGIANGLTVTGGSLATLSNPGSAGIYLGQNSGWAQLKLNGTVATNSGIIDFTAPGVTDYLARIIYQHSTKNLQLAVSDASGSVAVTNTTASSSPTTGALTVGGGIGANGVVFAGGGFYVNNSSNYVISDGTNCILRTGGGFYIQNLAGSVNYGVFSNTGLNVPGGISCASFTASGGTISASAGGYPNVSYSVAGAKTWVAGAWPDGSFNIYNQTDNVFGLMLNQYGNLNFGPGAAGGIVAILNVGGFYGYTFRGTSDPSYACIFYSAANTQVGYIQVGASSTGYATTSDGRLKDDLQPFDAGPIIDATMVYDFRWKETGERAHGVIAQEAVEVFAEAVTHNEEFDVFGVDYSKFVPLLLQEIKDLRARVAQLEAKQREVY
jgi:hypothetical protein